MRLSSTILAAVAAIPLASAFSDTSPFLAFTSRQSSLLDRGLVTRSTSSPAVAPLDIARSLTSKSQELCDLDGVMIVEVQELDSHSFQMLSSDSSLRSRALEAPSQLAFPHVSLSHGNAAREVRNAVQKSCRKVWSGKDNIKTLKLMSLLDDEALSSSLASFNNEFPNNLVMITSAPPRLILRKRASNDTDVGVDPKLGLLHRYQFFSTGLLIALLVMVMLLIPIVYFATGLLANIETPDRLGERSRGSGDKKSQ